MYVHALLVSPSQVLSNVDELFEREELSAAPDPGWPDCFNSGVFVFRPSIDTYGRILQLCSESGSFDGELFLYPGYVCVWVCVGRYVREPGDTTTRLQPA